MTTTPLTRVIATILALPLAAAPALAQEDTSNGEEMDSAQSETGSSDMQSGSDASSGDSQSAEGGAEGSMDGDRLIATVDGTEITAADVQTAIEGLPAQVRQQMPPEQLASMAVDQLVLRQLILDEAEADNLSEDPEVQELIEQNQRANEEDAILQVYVERQLEGAVTDEEVQQTYDQISSQSEQEVPPLEAVRPQIEQQLRQQRLGEVRDELMQDVEITYYGPDGEPMEASETTSGGMSEGGEDGASSGSGSSDSGSTEGGSSEEDGSTEGN